jgi:CRP-like cAMP-binding protein
MATARAKALESFPLFAGLSSRDRELVASNLDELSFPAGTTLITQGASNHTFFVVTRGEVEISVSGEPRRMIGPGGFFGEISMDERRWATATVVTKTPVEAFVMSHAQYGALSTNEAVMAKLRATRAARLQDDQKLRAHHDLGDEAR